MRPFQSVLLDLGARLQLPGMVDDRGAPKYRNYADYIANHERASGIGPLAGWRGSDGETHGRGPPNPDQLRRYIENGGFWHRPFALDQRYYKMANRSYLELAVELGFKSDSTPVLFQLYAEPLQRFRLAAEGHGPVLPPEADRARIATYFDPLPFWYTPFEEAQVAGDAFRFVPGTRRSL